MSQLTAEDARATFPLYPAPINEEVVQVRPRSRPFYPCQVPTGGTYVVDSRTGRVVRDFWALDLVARWRSAQKEAERMNNAFEARFYVRRRWMVLAVLAAVIFGAVFGVLSWG